MPPPGFVTIRGNRRRQAVADSQLNYFDAIAGEFEFGLGTLPVLIDARLAYEEAALGVVSARFSLLRQKLDLMRLTARMPNFASSGGGVEVAEQLVLDED